jgi:septal ring factor EnvC (AmiA/AmiB activator)
VAEENGADRIARLEREIETLKKEDERLRGLLEEALRAAQRQAAPFSQRHPKDAHQKPGRKPEKVRTPMSSSRPPNHR